jgi:hypothetical protein
MAETEYLKDWVRKEASRGRAAKAGAQAAAKAGVKVDPAAIQQSVNKAVDAALKGSAASLARKAEAAAKANATAKHMYIPVPKSTVIPGAVLGLGGAATLGYWGGRRNTEKLAKRREELFHSATEQDKRNMGRFALGTGIGIGSASIAAAIYLTMKKKASKQALETDPNKPVDESTERLVEDYQ